MQVRHGATLALAEVVLALHHIHESISDERLSSVAGIVPALEAGRLYRGKGGELMRACASRFVRLEYLPFKSFCMVWWYHVDLWSL